MSPQHASDSDRPIRIPVCSEIHNIDNCASFSSQQQIEIVKQERKLNKGFQLLLLFFTRHLCPGSPQRKHWSRGSSFIVCKTGSVKIYHKSFFSSHMTHIIMFIRATNFSRKLEERETIPLKASWK